MKENLHLAAMESKHHHIVWIAQWYPHAGEPFAGDFIQRHAQAVSAFIPLTVYACFGHSGAPKIERVQTGNLTEIIAYYTQTHTGIDKLDKMLNWNRWYRQLKHLLLAHEIEWGRPHLLHGHIILNTGWLGLWAQRKWQIPFIVTEHWAGYMTGFTNGFEAYNSWSKKKYRQIVQQAAVVTGVSQALIKELKAIELNGQFLRWPNVVNQQVFYYKPLDSKQQRPVFMHISTLTWQKNVDGILEALAIVKKSYPDILLKIAGPENKQLLAASQALNLTHNIVWLGEMPQQQLVLEMQSTEALVLFSQFESFGCVVIEANAVGLPVIVSNIEPLQELVQEGVNGLVVAEGNVTDLATAFMAIISKKVTFNAAAISKLTLDQYAFPIVGKQMADVYQNLLEINRD